MPGPAGSVRRFHAALGGHPLPAFAAAFRLAAPYGARLHGLNGWRARLSVFVDAVLLIRTRFAHPVRHRGSIGGMAMFWADDALAVWAALAAFGLLMSGAALVVGHWRRSS